MEWWMRLTRQAVVSGPPAEPDILFLRLVVGQLCVDAIGRRFWPIFVPAINTNLVPQGSHRVYMVGIPVHTSPVQASFNHNFLGALNAPGANR